MLNYERRDRLLALFGDPVEKLWSILYAMGFIFILRASQQIMSLDRALSKTLWSSEFSWAFHFYFQGP